MHNTLLNLSNEVIYPVLNVLHTRAADLLPRGGGIANMLPSYCIPAQRVTAAAAARGASALQRTFTALATPWAAAVLTPAPTPCLVGSVGGGVGVSCFTLPNTVNQCYFGRFWYHTEINIARAPVYEIAIC